MTVANDFALLGCKRLMERNSVHIYAGALDDNACGCGQIWGRGTVIAILGRVGKFGSQIHESNP